MFAPWQDPSASRGDRREPIVQDDVDQSAWVALLAHALVRLDAQAWAYCLMGNHWNDHLKQQIYLRKPGDQGE